MKTYKVNGKKVKAKSVLDAVKKVKDSNPLVQEVANLIKGVDSIFSARIINTLEDHGYDTDYGQTPSGYAVTAKKNGKTVCIISKNSVYPSADDIVQGNFVIGLIDSKTCKDESTKEKLIKLWAYQYGQSIAEAKMHINAMTPEEIERKYKALSQGQNSNAKKAFYEDSKTIKTKLWNPDFYLVKEPNYNDVKEGIRQVLKKSGLEVAGIELSVFNSYVTYSPTNKKLDNAQLKRALNELIKLINRNLYVDKLVCSYGQFKFTIEGFEYLIDKYNLRDSAIKDTSTVKAGELKIGDIIYSRYDNKHPELVKCRVDKIIRRSGLLNIQLSEVESGNYFKTTQVVPEATFIKDSAVRDAYNIVPGAIFKEINPREDYIRYIKITLVKNDRVTSNLIVKQGNQYRVIGTDETRKDLFIDRISGIYKQVSSLYDSAIRDSEFKKGDKVKISNDFHVYSLRGAEGIVEYIDEYINVKFTTGPEKGETHPYTPKSLVKVNDSAIKDKIINAEARTPEDLKKIIQSWNDRDDGIRVKVWLTKNTYSDIYYYHDVNGYYVIPTGIASTTTEYTHDRAKETALKYASKIFDSKSVKDADSDYAIYTLQSDVDKNLIFYIGKKYALKDGMFTLIEYSLEKLNKSPQQLKNELLRNGWHEISNRPVSLGYHEKDQTLSLRNKDSAIKDASIIRRKCKGDIEYTLDSEGWVRAYKGGNLVKESEFNVLSSHPSNKNSSFVRYATIEEFLRNTKLFDSAIKDENIDKPKIPALGKWEWDEAKQDWYDTTRKMYYTEIVRNSGERFGKYPASDSKCKDESMFMILNKDEGAYLYNVDISAAQYRLTNNANKADKFTLSEANRIINILKKYNFDNLTTSEFLDSECRDAVTYKRMDEIQEGDVISTVVGSGVVKKVIKVDELGRPMIKLELDNYTSFTTYPENKIKVLGHQ